ncbi:MAG: hypothetical protein AAF571_10450 [Verrucomicrobiota bacterium]
MRSLGALPVNQLYLGALVFHFAYFFLRGVEFDFVRFVAMYESSVAQAVEQVFATAGIVVRILESDAVACNADLNAFHVFPFCWYCFAQCWRLVTLSEGPTYSGIQILISLG